jgi:periplasmic protein TonB
MDVSPPPPLPPPPVLDPKPVADPSIQVSTSPDPKPPREHTELAPIDDDSATERPATQPGPEVIGNTPLGRNAPPIGMACLVKGACATARPQPPEPPEPPPSVFESIEVARERALASPNPPTDQLARTPAGIARRHGSSKVAFCIGPDGKTTDVRTRKSSGDREVDRICRETVARSWRFAPFRVDDRARTTCSEVTFQIAFE